MGLCGLLDVAWVGVQVFRAVTTGLNPGGFTKASLAFLAFSLVLHLVSGLWALYFAVKRDVFPYSRPILFVAALNHILLGLSLPAGWGLLFGFPVFLFVGLSYLVFVFRFAKRWS